MVTRRECRELGEELRNHIYMGITKLVWQCSDQKFRVIVRFVRCSVGQKE